MKVSIIIPVYNEEKTILKILNAIKEEIKKIESFKFEIIVVDDNSNDKTSDILNKNKNLTDIIITNPKNFGKGYSIRQGINNHSGDLILIQDADLEYLPQEYTKLLTPFIKYEADVVYGSRFKSSNINRVLLFWHYLANQLLTFLSNLFSDLNLSDVETGYKVFRSDIIKQINLRENSFAFEIEVTQKIANIKPKPKFFEVGINYFGRTYEEGKKIGFKDAVAAIIAIFRYGLRL